MKSALFFATAMLMTTGGAMAQEATPDQPTQAYIDAAFGRMDANGDGSIARSEFQTFMLARLAKQKAAFDASFKKADTDQDGKISKAEAGAANAQLAANFDAVDSNADGFVTAEEIRTAIRRAQAEELPAN